MLIELHAAIVITGNAIGAGRIADGIHVARRLTLLTALATALTTGAVYLLRVPLVGLFDVGDAAAQTAYGLLLSMMLFMPLRYSNWLMVGVYRAGGESLMGFWFEVRASGCSPCRWSRWQALSGS